MNHFTSIEQSKKLLELGLKAESADMWYLIRNNKPQDTTPYVKTENCGYLEEFDIPCWSVGQLLELMPEFVLDGDGQYYLKILKSYYHGIGIRYGNDFRIKASFVGENTFYKMICWLLQNNYIKTE